MYKLNQPKIQFKNGLNPFLNKNTTLLVNNALELPLERLFELTDGKTNDRLILYVSIGIFAMILLILVCLLIICNINSKKDKDSIRSSTLRFHDVDGNENSINKAAELESRDSEFLRRGSMRTQSEIEDRLFC